MGGGGGQENGGSNQGIQGFAVQNRVDDLIGATVILHFKHLVDGHTQQTAHRQQENQPIVLAPEVGDKVEHMMEACAHETADDAHQQTQNGPLEEGFDKSLGMMDFVKPCHEKYPLFCFYAALILA